MEKQRPSISVVDEQSSIFQNSSSVINWQSMYQREHQLRLKIEEQNKVLRIKYQRSIGKKNIKRANCQKCEGDITINRDVRKIKGELQTFSRQIQNRLNKIAERASQELIESSMEQIEDKQELNQSQIPFIQNFAVLGIDDDSICEYKKSDKEDPEGSVILSMRKITQSLEHAVHFAVPSGMSIKSIPSRKILQKVPKIMINHTKQNTFLLNFLPQAGRFDHLSPQAKQILDLLNPKRTLFCFCIGTYDFTYVKKGQEGQNDNSFTNNSFEAPRSINDSISSNNSQMLPSVPSVVQTQLDEDQIRVSQRVYCIFSYFPFFSFFSNILLSLLNLIKLERLQIFRDKIQDIRKIDSRFQLKRIKKLYLKYLRKFNIQPVRLDMVYHLNLMNQSLLLQIDRRQIIYSESQEWDYQIMSLFTLDTFMEVLTLFLLEDKLYFICDQSKILTFAVYLVSTYLCRPFKWAFQYICIVPKQQQFLNSPFPSAYGVLKKKQWIKEKQILQNFKNTYVFITPAGIEVKYTQKRNDILDKRSKKLRQELSPFFDKMKKRKKQKQQMLNYENQKQTDYNWYSEREDRNIVIGILQTVKKYMTNQVLRYIPTLETVRKIRDRVRAETINENKDVHSYQIQQIVKHIISQRDYKDPFVDQLLKTQMLSQHFTQLLDKLDN